jgi:putative flippase GtrA
VTLLPRLPYLRYVAASAGALAADFACFLAALTLAVPPVAASAIGYSAGIVAHWWLSSRAVFVGGLAQQGSARRRQQALFLGSAIVGLATTTTIVGIGAHAGIDPRLAKIAAVALSFQATWLLRSRIVFA